ncbi:MAG: hypothetical protein K8S94_00015 [Planctomycetia bacterium]|nr:hypothetical protein [Planctomycetia bacterium]
MAIAAVIAGSVVGCGRHAVERFDLAGTVTYDGKPVPKGYIVFRPDGSAGNHGPGAQADIRDGKYATLPGRGTIGGPHEIQLFGFDGKAYETPAGISGGRPTMNQMGARLFGPVMMKSDLPKLHATFDLVVPKQ